jgi:hypothetical protein
VRAWCRWQRCRSYIRGYRDDEAASYLSAHPTHTDRPDLSPETQALAPWIFAHGPAALLPLTSGVVSTEVEEPRSLPLWPKKSSTLLCHPEPAGEGSCSHASQTRPVTLLPLTPGVIPSEVEGSRRHQPRCPRLVTTTSAGVVARRLARPRALNVSRDDTHGVAVEREQAGLVALCRSGNGPRSFACKLRMTA